MVKENLRILFFGTPAFGAKVLEALFSYQFDIVGVITQPAKRSGRGNVIASSKVKETADKRNLLVYQPTSQNEILNITKDLNPDLIVTAAYGKIISADILNVPKFSAINVHASLLPRYRGASPVAAAILNGDTTTGVSIIKMTDQVDAGPVISKVEIKLNETETTEVLYTKLAELGADEVVRIIPLYVGGQLRPKEQEGNKATYCSVIKKGDGLIDWERKAIDIERTIRAFIPWPNAYTYIDGKFLKILEAKVVEKVLEPGNVVVLPESFLVGCGTDSLEIKKLQLEGRNVVTAKEFILGYRDLDGKTLGKS